jgi:sugar/nucleoside kinase (ribokinase family)
MTSLNIDSRAYQYQAMLGVGGIGTGAFFALDGNHTLGREESRSGRFLDRRDYCKLHIICHYVKVLLGCEFEVIPIGKVGGDEPGQRLLEEMQQIGLNLRYVESRPGEQTLYSFCFLYPDGSGGNLTVGDSVCSKVDPAFVAQVESEFACYQGSGLALAVPEVPLLARYKLLRLGTEFDFFRVAAFISAEIQPAIKMGLLGMTDLLAINLDEAGAVVGVEPDHESPFSIVEAAIQKLAGINPAMIVSITAGKWGSWVWDKKNISHIPAFPAQVVNTAGAGDAFLAGLIVGLVGDLSLSQAQELGTLVAAFSVTSPHTINAEIERRSLFALSSQSNFPLSEVVCNLLQDIKKGDLND